MLTRPQQWLLIGRFAFAGPLLGAAMQALWLAALAAAGGPQAEELPMSWTLGFLYLGLPYFIALGYLYGLAAAVLSGLAAALLFRHELTAGRVALLLAVAAASSFGNVYLINPQADFAARAACGGALSAALCCVFFLPRGPGSRGAAGRPPSARRGWLAGLGALWAAPVRTQADPGAASWYQAALRMRQLAESWGDQSYGAVLVRDGRIIGEGPSRVRLNADPDAHAEREALKDAAARHGEAALRGALLVSTSRPCAACEQAAARAGVARMIYGADLRDGGAPVRRD